jgi:hypothetical protein
MNKFKMFGGFAVGGAILAATVGSAAGLGIGPGAIQQGTLSNLACDSDGVSIHYNTTITGGTTLVNKVTVDNISSSCAGGEMDVILKDGSGNQLWWGQSDVPPAFPGGSIIAGANGSGPSPMLISPAAIESVQVSIYDTYQ